MTKNETEEAIKDLSQNEEYLDFLSFLANESLIHLRNILQEIETEDEVTDDAREFLDEFSDFIVEDDDVGYAN